MDKNSFQTTSEPRGEKVGLSGAISDPQDSRTTIAETCTPLAIMATSGFGAPWVKCTAMLR